MASPATATNGVCEQRIFRFYFFGFFVRRRAESSVVLVDHVLLLASQKFLFRKSVSITNELEHTVMIAKGLLDTHITHQTRESHKNMRNQGEQKQKCPLNQFGMLSVFFWTRMARMPLTSHTHTNFGGVLGEYIHLDYTPAHNTEHTSSSNLVCAFSTNGRHSRAH